MLGKAIKDIFSWISSFTLHLLLVVDQVEILKVFKSVLVIVFQSIFHFAKHQNNIYFYFLKFIFDISISK
jgi:hypothetical protein